MPRMRRRVVGLPAALFVARCPPLRPVFPSAAGRARCLRPALVGASFDMAVLHSLGRRSVATPKCPRCRDHAGKLSVEAC